MMENIVWFHNWLLIIITIITLFVLALLIMVVVKFNSRANPIPSRTTHNTLIEVAWTLIPVLILVGIAVPSFRLLFQELDIPKADLTIKATGKQWYWSYSYPDNGKFEFDSLMLKAGELKQDQPRLLAVDNEMVVPVNKNVIVQVKANDVIHDFAVPSFGIKLDAVPGRLQRTWFRAERTGMFGFMGAGTAARRTGRAPGSLTAGVPASVTAGRPARARASNTATRPTAAEAIRMHSWRPDA